MEIGISYAITEGDQRAHEAPMDVEVQLVPVSRFLVVAAQLSEVAVLPTRHQRLRGLMQSLALQSPQMVARSLL